MKLKSIALVFLCSFMLNIVFAQKSNFSPANTKHNIKFGLNTDFDGDPFVLGVAWEFKVAKRNSIQLELFPKSYKDNYSQRNGLAASFSIRRYLDKNKEGIQGIYISEVLKFGRFDENYFSTYSSKRKYTNSSMSVLFGKQWIFKSGFSLDVNGGFGFYNKKIDKVYVNYPVYNNKDINYGILPTFNLKIGYAF